MVSMVSISLALPVDYCNKRVKSYTKMISCDVQKVAEQSNWNNAI